MRIPSKYFLSWLALLAGMLAWQVFPMSVWGQGNPPGGIRPPSEIDGSALSGQVAQDPAANPVANAPSDTAQALIRELDSLIPGDFVAGSPQQQAIAQVVAAFQARNADEVVKLLEAEVQANPDYPPVDVLLAALSYSTKDDNTGLLLLERAAKSHPEDPAVYSAFARLAINTRRTTDAKVLFEKLRSVVQASQLSDVARKFYTTQYLDGLIDVALSQGRLEDAQQLLGEQREMLPDHPKVLMVSAELEFRRQQIDRCLDFLRQMKQKFPQTRTPEAILASWYQRTGDQQGAATWIRKAADTYPEDPQVQLEYASWSINQEDFPTALAAIKKAEDVTQETPLSRTLKAKISFARQSYGVAELHYQALIAAQPMDSDLSNMYALSLVESDDAEKRSRALGIATRNLQALPNNRVALASLGYVHLRMGDLEKARQLFAQVTQTAGSSPEIDYFVASYLAQANEPAQAARFLDRALAYPGLFLYRSAAQQLRKTLDVPPTNAQPPAQPAGAPAGGGRPQP